MNLLYILLVLLLVTRLSAELAERFRQPALVGELVAGIGLGVLAHRYSDVLPMLAGLPAHCRPDCFVTRNRRRPRWQNYFLRS